MAITQETHWDDVGIEPGVGDAEYTAGQQPIAEYDNWFNWSAAKDVENLIAALENVTTGHDHDGANSKQVDGSDVVNTPAGNIAATDVQAAINELDTEKETPAGAQDKIDTHAADTSTHGVAEVADKATVTAEIDADIATHEADTSVHGVAEVAGMADIVKGGFGDGSDGNVTISADTDLNGVAKQYNNLTINAGFKLYDSTGILIVRVKDTLTLNGDINQNGQGSAGGAGGAGVSNSQNAGVDGDIGVAGKPGAGGAGGAASSGNGASGTGNGGGGGGGGGTNSAPYGNGGAGADSLLGTKNIIGDVSTGTTHPHDNYDYDNWGKGGGGGGSGGGGGVASPAGGDGGNGGAGGGMAYIAAKIILGSGTISCDGINGANATGNNYSGGGGGGGGNGGYLDVSYTSNASATITANKGSGGSGFVSTQGNGGNGTDGKDGYLKNILIS